MRRLLLVAACIASCALLGVRAHPATAAPETAGTGASGSFDAQASQIVADIAAGDFADVEAQFDPTMAAQLPQDQLANAWVTYQQLLGDFQTVGGPTSVMLGDLTVEQVPVQLAGNAGEVRIVFHPDGTIAGLFFLTSGVPVP